MSENRNRNWVKISCIGCFLLPLIALLATLGWFKFQVGKKADQLPAELAKLKAMGVATEPADLAPKLPIPDSQNAANLYRELFTDLEKLEVSKEDARAANEYGTYKATPAGDKVAIQVLDKMSGFFGKTERLADYPYLDFKRDYSQGAGLLFPEYAHMKETARWQSARVRRFLRVKDSKGSLRTLRAMFAIPAHVNQEPTIIGSLVAIAVDAIALRVLEEHLETFKGDQAVLAQTRKLMESLPAEIDLKKPLQGEVVMGRITIQQLRSWKDVQMLSGDNGDEIRNNLLDKVTFEDPTVRRMFEAKFVQQWRIAFEKMPKNGTDWQGILKTMAGLEESISNDRSLENTLNQILFPVFSGFAQAGGNYQARHRLVLLAIRLLQDRPKGLPADLSRYGKLGIDPIDGNPMRYDVKGGGFKIWSVGRDGKDNGGAKLYPGMSSQDTDEVLHFFYPEKAPPPRK